MMDKFKSIISQNIHIVDVLFGSLWLFAWYNNANYATKYDLIQLTAFYAVMRGYILAGRVNDSVNNSEKGSKPL